MKKMKKIMAVLLAAVMTLAMAVTAFADEGKTTTGNGTLTVSVKSGTTPAQTLKDQTIYLYKLFDVTESGSDENAHYAYTVNTTDGYKKAIVSALNNDKITEDSTDEEIENAVSSLGSDNAKEVQNFANAFRKYALKNKVAATKDSGKIIDETKTDYQFTGLEYGYYLVCVGSVNSIQASLLTVDATHNAVALKSEAPDITKTADKDAATVHVGQTVTYTIKGTVPDMTGYDNYVYKIHDTLTDGLDFVTNDNGTKVKVSVKINGTEVADVTTADFVGSDGNVSDTATRTMLLDLSQKVQAATAGQEIEVTYQATVNKDAVVETKNSASLEYSNNPGDEKTGTTKPHEVVTPTYPLDVKKTDTHSTMLADAHFTLYGANEDGTIDKTNVIKVTKDTDANGKYTYAEDQNATDAITDVITVGSGIDEKDYNLHINGLKAGVYYLEETQAPDGYNKLAAPVKVTIKKIGDTDYTVSTPNKQGVDTEEEDKIIDIENSTGSLLPSTGGRGAIAFGIVAAILVFGVVVSFMRDKRKANL